MADRITYVGLDVHRESISGHAVPIRASEYDQPSFRRPRLLPYPEELEACACTRATNSLACIW